MAKMIRAARQRGGGGGGATTSKGGWKGQAGKGSRKGDPCIPCWVADKASTASHHFTKCPNR